MARARIALVGDFDPAITAHQAIEQCFRLAQAAESLAVEPTWVPTEAILTGDESAFQTFHGLWCVPASPYRNTEGALWAIQFARERLMPFLGTCGGFQHAVLEYARNVLGLEEAGHAEEDPATVLPIIHLMECALVEKTQNILIKPNHVFRNHYGADHGQEGFRCSFGLNPKYNDLFESSPLEFVARDDAGAVRAVALLGHPFFVGTLFQPERKALNGALHPLVKSFFAACVGAAG